MASSDIDAALAGSAKQGRTPMGKDGRKFSSPSASPTAGTLVPKKGAQAADPTGSKGTPRVNVPAAPGGERIGAAYSVKVNYMKPTDPAAGMTQANGRIISPSVVRSTESFSEGVGTSY
jgi:hypothetical protein